MVKVIDIPATIKTKPAGAAPEMEISFKDWLVKHLDVYQEIKTVSQIRQASKIVDAIEAANGTLALEDADFAVLKGAVEKPFYVPGINRQLLPYYDAMDKAQDIKK